jgi:small subunit ribosomal protein S14
MAKLSSINKNERRKKLVKQVCRQVCRLKAIADDKSLDDTERLIARLKLAEIPRNGEPDPGAQPLRHHRPPARLLSQVRSSAASSCGIMANKGMIPGVTKSSW